MRVNLLPIMVLFAACDDIEIRPVPATREPAPVVLEAGTYDIRVDDVKSSTCGFDPRDMVGQHVWADLAVVRGESILAFGGWTLRGEMSGNTLYVEGGPDAVDPGEPPRDEPGDTGGGEPEPVEEGGGGDASEPDTGGDDRPDDGDRPDDDRPDDGDRPDDDRPDTPPDSRAFASLDAAIRDRGLADGRLTVEAEGCRMELAVVLTRGERPDEPVYAESDEEADEG